MMVINLLSCFQTKINTVSNVAWNLWQKITNSLTLSILKLKIIQADMHINASFFSYALKYFFSSQVAAFSLYKWL